MQAKIKSFIFSSIIISLLAIPFSNVVLAAADSRIGTDSNAGCTRFTNVASEVGKRLGELDSKRAGWRDQIKTKLQTRRDDRHTKVLQIRTEAEAKFSANIKALQDQASTDAQKQAVADFKTAIKAAQTTRKAAVDKAQETFRAGIDSLVGSNQTSITAEVTTFKSSVQTAVNTAKTDCAAGGTATTIRATLMASVKTAQEKLKTDLQALNQHGAQVEALAKTRNEAIKQADQAFRAILQSEKAKLKAAFPTT